MEITLNLDLTMHGWGEGGVNIRADKCFCDKKKGKNDSKNDWNGFADIDLGKNNKQ